MRRKISRTIVIWLSILVAILGFGYYGALRFQGHFSPLWDKVAMAYGGVFLVFLFFDEVGRQAAKHRQESDARKLRPRPRPSTVPGQQVAVAHTLISGGQLRLERVKQGQEQMFQDLVDAAFTEVLALEGTLPARDENGHVFATDVMKWMEDSHFYPFYIQYHDTCIGCCVLHPVRPNHEILLYYIIPSMRRRRGGSNALNKLIEFASLVGSPDGMVCEVSKNNMRAQRFFEKHGFHGVAMDRTKHGHVEMLKPFLTGSGDMG